MKIAFNYKLVNHVKPELTLPSLQQTILQPAARAGSASYAVRAGGALLRRKQLLLGELRQGEGGRVTVQIVVAQFPLANGGVGQPPRRLPERLALLIKQSTKIQTNGQTSNQCYRHFGANYVSYRENKFVYYKNVAITKILSLHTG
jgi:hypothetical protein